MIIKHELFDAVSAFYGSTDHNFNDVLAEWIGIDEVIAFKVNEKSGNVIVVTRCYNGLKAYTYSVFRAFTVSGSWNISADLQNATVEDAMQRLLDYVK